MSVLALEKVNYAYEKMARKLLENVTLEFEEGKFYAGNSVFRGGEAVRRGLRRLFRDLRQAEAPFWDEQVFAVFLLRMTKARKPLRSICF